jgi:glycosyltransferase involved in cell wall biosynthesis
MIPRVIAHTICKDEDRWIAPTIRAWAPFCYRMKIWDTGSRDGTYAILRNMVDSSVSMRQVVELRQVGRLGVDQAMAIRHDMIQQTQKDDDIWILILDADEIWHPDMIAQALMHLRDPEIDYLGVRPIPFGEDCRFAYYDCVFQDPDPNDVDLHSTMYWCPKYTIRFHRSTRLDGVYNATWGLETFGVKIDPDRHERTSDFVDRNLPEGLMEVQYTGRARWTDIGYFHASLIKRSSLRVPRRNAPATHPIPAEYETPLEVKRRFEAEFAQAISVDEG